MTVILTSDFPASPNAEVVTRLQACGAKARVAWIAPSPASRLTHFPLARWRFRSFGITNLEFVDAGAPPPEQQDPAGRFDAIYLSGGDPLVFRERLERSGLARQIRAFALSGRPVIAASGGAMQLTANVSVYRLLSCPLERVVSEHASFGALGLAGFEILPHLDRHAPSFVELVRRYSAAIGHDVVAMADGAAVVCDDSEARHCSGQVVSYRRGAVHPATP